MSRADVSKLMKPIHPFSPNYLSAPTYGAKIERKPQPFLSRPSYSIYILIVLDDRSWSHDISSCVSRHKVLVPSWCEAHRTRNRVTRASFGSLDCFSARLVAAGTTATDSRYSVAALCISEQYPHSRKRTPCPTRLYCRIPI
jgi:hypothetical protein